MVSENFLANDPERLNAFLFYACYFISCFAWYIGSNAFIFSVTLAACLKKPYEEKGEGKTGNYRF